LCRSSCSPLINNHQPEAVFTPLLQLQAHFAVCGLSYLLLTCLLRFLKYFRLVINCIAFWCYKPVPLSDEPKFTPDDVTVVIPTLDGDNDKLRETVRSVLTNGPHKVILITIDANIAKAKAAFSGISKAIDLYSIPKANKRRQLCKALPLITTEITILADDDVSWPPNLLSWMLSPFEDERMGGVGTNQRLRREEKPNIWNWLGAAYLIRRNWDCTACEFMDGGLPCLSGRTVAYRTHIIRDPNFIHSFTHETWQSCQLNADDDNFLTRWMVNHGWKTWIQYHRDCEVETTLEDNSKYLLQCLRWARSNWRSNLKSLFVEWTVWRYVGPRTSYGIGRTAFSYPNDSKISS
jgi:cellulose synthase/poly-beta-1,6-N-acetylglucosamine synthase-like glycosyltransferase